MSGDGCWGAQLNSQERGEEECSKMWRKDVQSGRLTEEVGQAWIPMVHDVLAQGGRAIILVCLHESLGCAREALHNPSQR